MSKQNEIKNCCMHIYIYYIYIWMECIVIKEINNKIVHRRIYNTHTFDMIVGSLIARFMGPTCDPSGADRSQVGPMLAPWTLLSGTRYSWTAVCYLKTYMGVHFQAKTATNRSDFNSRIDAVIISTSLKKNLPTFQFRKHLFQFLTCVFFR